MEEINYILVKITIASIAIATVSFIVSLMINHYRRMNDYKAINEIISSIEEISNSPYGNFKTLIFELNDNVTIDNSSSAIYYDGKIFAINASLYNSLNLSKGLNKLVICHGVNECELKENTLIVR